MKVNRHELRYCVCGYKLDASTDLAGQAEPSKGDISICLQCGRLHVFDDNNFRPMTDEEFLNLPQDFKTALNKLEKTRKEAMEKFK